MSTVILSICPILLHHRSRFQMGQPATLTSFSNPLYLGDMSERRGTAVRQAIGQKLRELRQRKGLTQKELARTVRGKVDYSYIGKIERGEQLPSLKVL